MNKARILHGPSSAAAAKVNQLTMPRFSSARRRRWRRFLLTPRFHPCYPMFPHGVAACRGVRRPAGNADRRAKGAPGRMSQFFGRHTNRLDAKGRVSIPASFRAALRRANEGDGGALVLRPSHKHRLHRGLAARRRSRHSPSACARSACSAPRRTTSPSRSTPTPTRWRRTRRGESFYPRARRTCEAQRDGGVLGRWPNLSDLGAGRRRTAARRGAGGARRR